jgi:hypothetical protein
LAADQSFGTHPRPGTYSRLPEEDLHPAAANISAARRIRQSFDMLEK